jgi:Cysteine rich repeat
MQRQNAGRVSFDCKQELFRQDVENAGDVRLSVQLMRMCAGEMQVFCAQAKPGGDLARKPLAAPHQCHQLATLAAASWHLPCVLPRVSASGQEPHKSIVCDLMHTSTGRFRDTTCIAYLPAAQATPTRWTA